jgi:hypothetical protein
MVVRKPVRTATARALEERYPGVTVTIHWISHEELSGPARSYRGWHIAFEAPDAQTLVGYGLARLEEFERTATVPADQFGHYRHAHGIVDASGQFSVGIHIPDVPEENARKEKGLHTKKMQKSVAQMIKRAFKLPRREARAKG